MEKFSYNPDNNLDKTEIDSIKTLVFNENKMQEFLESKDQIENKTNNDFINFINTEYRWANENYLEQNWKTVFDLQIALNKNIKWEKLVLDWLFWKKTFKALIDFQKENWNLVVDWLSWSETSRELFWEIKATDNENNLTSNNYFSNLLNKTLSFIGISNSFWESQNNYISNLNKSPEKEYYKLLISDLSDKYNVPEDKVISLINHENHKWDINIKSQYSSAYWLWQMIDSTWKRFWIWLDRNSPEWQIEATLRYMSYIKSTKQCSWEEVLAYYNTWEWILNISNYKAKEFYDNNPIIARKIPFSKEYITPEIYFNWAVAYYNNLSYNEALKIVA